MFKSRGKPDPLTGGGCCLILETGLLCSKLFVRVTFTQLYKEESLSRAALKGGTGWAVMASEQHRVSGVDLRSVCIDGSSHGGQYPWKPCSSWASELPRAIRGHSASWTQKGQCEIQHWAQFSVAASEVGLTCISDLSSRFFNSFGRILNIHLAWMFFCTSSLGLCCMRCLF